MLIVSAHFCAVSVLSRFCETGVQVQDHPYNGAAAALTAAPAGT